MTDPIETTRLRAPDIFRPTRQTDGLFPPNFRLMTVTFACDLTPHMRRLTLHGEDLGRFDSTDLHVRLLIAPQGRTPEWPRLGEDGVIVWPQGEAALQTRKYTLRRIDVAAGMVEIDMVVHDDAGPGSAFAISAVPRDVIGMTGPGGGGHRAAAWNVLAGDEAALPAISRILEFLPASARGITLIEVADVQEEQPLALPAGMKLRWLHRNGAEPGTTTLLVDAIRDIAWPEADRFAWIGCEYEAFRTIRSYLRTDCGLSRDEHLAVAYWRRGEPEDSFAASRRSDRAVLSIKEKQEPIASASSPVPGDISSNPLS